MYLFRLRGYLNHPSVPEVICVTGLPARTARPFVPPFFVPTNPQPPHRLFNSYWLLPTGYWLSATPYWMPFAPWSLLLSQAPAPQKTPQPTENASQIKAPTLPINSRVSLSLSHDLPIKFQCATQPGRRSVSAHSSSDFWKLIPRNFFVLKYGGMNRVWKGMGEVWKRYEALP